MPQENYEKIGHDYLKIVFERMHAAISPVQASLRFADFPSVSVRVSKQFYEDELHYCFYGRSTEPHRRPAFVHIWMNEGRIKDQQVNISPNLALGSDEVGEWQNEQAEKNAKFSPLIDHQSVYRALLTGITYDEIITGEPDRCPAVMDIFQKRPSVIVHVAQVQRDPDFSSLKRHAASRYEAMCEFAELALEQESKFYDQTKFPQLKARFADGFVLIRYVLSRLDNFINPPSDEPSAQEIEDMTGIDIPPDVYLEASKLINDELTSPAGRRLHELAKQIGDLEALIESNKDALFNQAALSFSPRHKAVVGLETITETWDYFRPVHDNSSS